MKVKELVSILRVFDQDLNVEIRGEHELIRDCSGYLPRSEGKLLTIKTINEINTVTTPPCEEGKQAKIQAIKTTLVLEVR